MTRLAFLLLLPALLLAPAPARAFCGFYVAKADTKLFNSASKVVMARKEGKTVLTMANDYQGPLEEFAVVIPVPTFIEEGQIHVGDMAVVDHLDAYSAPRLVEYFDEDPCRPAFPEVAALGMAPRRGKLMALADTSARSLGVTIEATYTVGEYDIQILSAENSAGLVTWLNQEGYRIPDGAEPVVGAYLKQGLRFFVAKVNLEAQAASGFTYLRPLQVAYDSERFTLPIRLGTINANGRQELFLFTLTSSGRVETSNYRTVKLPSGMDVPLYVKDDFGPFYKDMFAHQVEKEKGRAVFTEYAWNMAWCDPCAADPLSAEELSGLGVFWADGGAQMGGGQPVYVTRLHLSYDAKDFPEDLALQETGDQENYQGRYVLRHPFTQPAICPAAETYRAGLPARFEAEAAQLADLTGWDLPAIRDRMEATGQSFTPVKGSDTPWWRRIWPEK